MAAHQLVGIIQLRSGQQIQADGVDHDSGGSALDDQVIGLDLWIELKAILETTAPPGQHGNAKGGFGGLLRLGDDLGNPGGGTIGNGELFHVAEDRRFHGKIEAAPVIEAKLT